jgi:hypothetical protein
MCVQPTQAVLGVLSDERRGGIEIGRVVAPILI